MDISQTIITSESTVRDVMNTIDRAGIGIALLVDSQNRLLATITDGDVRRGILAGLNFDATVEQLVSLKNSFAVPQSPIVAKAGVSDQELLDLMQKMGVHHIPLINDDGQLVSIATLDEVVNEKTLPLQALIMAGGFGTRLRPLTNDLPKPMLPIGGVPLIERIVRQFKKYGIRQINVSLHYLPQKIKDHLQDGSDFGVEIDYLYEDTPLGTGGALALLADPSKPIVVINGDISTTINFDEMYQFHKRYNSSITVGTRYYDVTVPYGIVETEGVTVTRLREKPTYRYLANAGIYIVEPSTLPHVVQGEKFNMTDLIDIMIDQNQVVSSYPISEYWLDIGQLADYEQAQNDFESGRVGE